MELINLKDFERKEDIYQIWNDEYGNIYPISAELFNRNIENMYPKASYVAIKDEKIVGFVIGKVWHDSYVIKNYNGIGWISLIYVTPKYRKQGIGSALLDKATIALKDFGVHTINLGKDYNNFFPGLPIDLTKYRTWFEKRGFEFTYQTHDLITRNNKNKFKIVNNNYKFTSALGFDKDLVIKFIETYWPGRWTKEAVDYYNNGGNGNEYLLCLNDKNEICGFAKVCFPNTLEKHMSYSLTWRTRFEALGGIGPLGIAPDLRGQHLGYDIVVSSLNNLINFGISDIIIDWTGLLEFYRKMGFEVWKVYFYLQKKLN
jgi:GNAT superfamily N-acetyltransferase